MTSIPNPAPNVVPMRPRHGCAASYMTDRVLHHWLALCGPGPVPARAALDPRAFGPALPHAFLLERTGAGRVRFRLAGQHLSALMGMDVRGMPLRAFFELPDRQRLMQAVTRVFEEPARLRLDLVSDAQGRAVLTGQMLVLPLLDRAGAITRALGVLASEGPIGLPPRRFRIRHLHLAPLGAPLDRPRPDPAPGGRASLKVISGGRG